MAKKVKYPPLTKEQQALVRDNLKFVYKIANSFYRLGHKDDLISEGCLGLCIAAAKFDPQRNVKFTTYSAWWIRAAIFNYLLRSHGPTHILSSDRRVFFSLLRSQTELKENPEDRAALAEHLDVDVKTIDVMESRVKSRDMMLDAPLNDGHKQREMVDQDPLPDENAANSEEQTQLRQHVSRALRHLDERERLVIRSRTMADQPRRLEELGETFGVSRQRVKQIEQIAFKKLRVRLLQVGLPLLLANATATPATMAVPTATVPQERARRE
jgi:RNA polymerase sigma-32 factor